MTFPWANGACALLSAFAVGLNVGDGAPAWVIALNVSATAVNALIVVANVTFVKEP